MPDAEGEAAAQPNVEPAAPAQPAAPADITPPPADVVATPPASPVGQEPTLTPSAPTPSAPTPSAPAWTPPDTFSDRFSRGSTAAVRYSVAGLGLLSLVLWVLWLIPTIVVSTSDSYRIARETVAAAPSLQRYIGEPIVCERIPTWYRVGEPEGDLFRFQGQGSQGFVQVEVRVKDGVATIAPNAIVGLNYDY